MEILGPDQLIKTDPADLWTIRGIVLPNSDFVGVDEELCAAALGYTAHLTFMLSKYLDVRGWSFSKGVYGILTDFM